MILCGVVLVALIGIRSVAITQGQNHDDYSNQGDGCSFLRQGYFDHYGCTLECFRTTFGLEYMRGNLCTSYYELYSNDWGDVPFKKVVTVIECITINCRRAVPQAVCSNSYDYSSNKYQPQGNQNSPNTQPPAYSSSDSSNQNSQPVTQSAPGSTPNDENNNEDASNEDASIGFTFAVSKSKSYTDSISTSQSPFASTSAYAEAMDKFLEYEYSESLTSYSTDTTTDETTIEYSSTESSTAEYSTLDTTTCDSTTDSTLTDAATEASAVSTTPPTDYTEEPCDDTPPANPDNNGGYPWYYNPANSNYNTQNNYNSYGSAVANSGGNSNDKPVQASQNSDGQQQNPGNQISNNYNTNTNSNNNNNNNKFDTTYEIDGIYQNPFNSNNGDVVSYIEKDYITQVQSGNSQPGNSGVASSQNQPAIGQESQNYQGATSNNQFYQKSYDNSAQPIQNPKQSPSAPTNATTQNTSNNGFFSFLTNLIKPLASQPPTSKSPSTVSDQTVNNQLPGNYQGTPNAAQSGNPFYPTWSAAQGPNYQNQLLYPSASNIPVQSNSQPVDSLSFSGVLPPSSQGPSNQIPPQFPFDTNNNYPSYPAPQSSSPVWGGNSFPFWGLPQSNQGPSYQNPSQFPFALNNNYPQYTAPQSSSSAWANSFPGWGYPQSSQGISNQNPPQFPFVSPQSGPQRINAQNGGPSQGDPPVFKIQTNDDQITIYPSGEMVLTQLDGIKKTFKLNQ